MRGMDQPRDLILMDYPAPLLWDSTVRVANRTEGERLRKAKEDKKKKKKKRKLRAWERGEDTDNGDDDDEVMEEEDT